MDDRKRMEELVAQLSQAARVYYQESREIMSNYTYDALYDELETLERRTGIVLAQSPTHKVGYEVRSELPKESHPSPMLSLDKTKEVTRLQEWLGGQPGMLSWKLDGLTIVLTYKEGHLVKALTRGNGTIGEVVTPNARAFENLPVSIPYKGELVLRGEAVIRYSDFESINRALPELDSRYKNPRNLCAGSVRQLNSQVTAERHVRFYAFGLVSFIRDQFVAGAVGPTLEEVETWRHAQLDWLKALGFETVFYRLTDQKTLPKIRDWFAEAIRKEDIPSDGLVLTFDNIAFGAALGQTAKFPRHSIAYKWEDEQALTHLLEVEWSPSRTGLLNPVAVFEPVELEGTQVSRASVHNVSIVEELRLGIGDEIKVYKANMIIPQISENLTGSGRLAIPERCPACGGKTTLQQDGDVRVLRCMNPDCPAKKIKSYALFASRDGLNIEGMSEATIEKLIGQGWVHGYGDLFRLEVHREAFVQLEGFGEKSYEKLQEALKRARHTTTARLLYALGIPGIGAANARMIGEAFGGDWEALRHATKEALTAIPGVGEIMAEGYMTFMEKPENQKEIQDLLDLLEVEKPKTKTVNRFIQGKTFVITGAVHQFENRKALQQYIEERGGKVTSSVTGQTQYLINNDNASASSKNKKAQALGVPVITEAEFLQAAREGETVASTL